MKRNKFYHKYGKFILFFIIILFISLLFSYGYSNQFHFNNLINDANNKYQDIGAYFKKAAKCYYYYSKSKITPELTTEFSKNILSEQVNLYKELSTIVDQYKPFSVTPDGEYGNGAQQDAKVFLLGIDGADWGVLTPLLETGRLPNFERLLRKSSYGVMDTDIALSPASWTSIATGKRHEKTIPVDVSTPQVWELDTAAIQCRRIWDIFAEVHQSKVIIVKYYFPPAQGEYPNISFYNGNFFDLNEDIWGEKDFDLYVSMINETDDLQHSYLFYHYMNTIPEFSRLIPKDKLLVEKYLKEGEKIVTLYRKIDQLIGVLLDRNPDDYIFIVSDHGFSIGPPSLEIGFGDKFLHCTGITQEDIQTEGLVKNVFIQQSRMINIETFFKATFSELLKDQITGKDIPFKVLSKEIAFSPEFEQDSETADQMHEQLKECIKQCPGLTLSVERSKNRITLRVTENAMKAARLSYESDKIPEGQMYDCLQIAMAPSFHDHDDHGIFIANGPGIRKGYIIDKISLFDVTPTILYLKGYPVGEDMDGKVIVEMINPELLDSMPIVSIPTYDDEHFLSTRVINKQELTSEQRERLQTLGYLQ